LPGGMGGIWPVIVWLHRNVRKLNCSRNLASPVKTISEFALHSVGTILMLAV